jgi:hypothetical protein
MKKNKNNKKQRKSAVKRAKKRSTRLKTTQKEKHVRKEAVVEGRKKAEINFEKQMSDLFGKR